MSNEVSRLPGTWIVVRQKTFACVKPSTWLEAGCPLGGVRVAAAPCLPRQLEVIGWSGAARGASARPDEVVSAKALTEPHSTAMSLEFVDIRALPIEAIPPAPGR